MLGLPVPAGPALETLALGRASEESFTPKTDGLQFSVSGLENKTRAMLENGEKAADIAYFTLRSIAELLSIVLERAVVRFPGRPILCAGGVMSNAMIRSLLESRFGAVFAKPEYSSDNAAGIAYLAAAAYQKGEEPIAKG
jgi:N6-L-threonylcarbamoyladenine synthase